MELIKLRKRLRARIAAKNVEFNRDFFNGTAPMKSAQSISGQIHNWYNAYHLHLAEIGTSMGFGQEETSFSVPSALPSRINDIFLNVKYAGGSAELLDHGVTLTDDLYNGTEWRIGLKRYAGKRLSIKAKPWDKNLTGVNPALVKKVSASLPSVESVEVKAEYLIEVK